MQADGGPFATRVTSTAALTAAELDTYELQGTFRGFLGTPISAIHFLTAQHVGISISDTISFASGPNTGTYTILQWFDDPESDLRIVEINEAFADWAEVNAAGGETGAQATIFGRGGAPNASIFVSTELKGWTAAGPDGSTSWGRNLVTGSLGTNFLYARFDRNGIVGEAGLSVGDSGGAWFTPDAFGTLRLSAISLAVTGPYQQDAGGAPDGMVFEAALFDIGGLWVGPLNGETFIPENPVDSPGVAIASRVSSRIDWIASIVPIPLTDADADGIPDSQDNCPFIPNADQADSGGLGFGTTPDGIGNVCQCGDVTGEGQANETDAIFIKRYAIGIAAPLFLVPDNCDVNGDGICSGSDGTLIEHAAAGSPPAIFGQNCPSAQP